MARSKHRPKLPSAAVRISAISAHRKFGVRGLFASLLAKRGRIYAALCSIGRPGLLFATLFATWFVKTTVRFEASAENSSRRSLTALSSIGHAGLLLARTTSPRSEASVILACYSLACSLRGAASIPRSGVKWVP